MAGSKYEAGILVCQTYSIDFFKQRLNTRPDGNTKEETNRPPEGDPSLSAMQGEVWNQRTSGALGPLPEAKGRYSAPWYLEKVRRRTNSEELKMHPLGIVAALPFLALIVWRISQL